MGPSVAGAHALCVHPCGRRSALTALVVGHTTRRRCRRRIAALALRRRSRGGLRRRACLGSEAAKQARGRGVNVLAAVSHSRRSGLSACLRSRSAAARALSRSGPRRHRAGSARRLAALPRVVVADSSPFHPGSTRRLAAQLASLRLELAVAAHGGPLVRGQCDVRGRATLDTLCGPQSITLG